MRVIVHSEVPRFKDTGSVKLRTGKRLASLLLCAKIEKKGWLKGLLRSMSNPWHKGTTKG